MAALDANILPTLDKYPECQPEDAVSCRVVYDWTGNEVLADAAEWVIGKPLAILTLVLVGLVARWLVGRAIDRMVRRAEAGIVPGRLGRAAVGDQHTASASRRVQRARTMGSLLKSIVTIVIFTIVVMMVLAEVGFSLGPLLASAGIVGIALGFGAQSLVTDFLSGIFMIFEDQYGVGDEVDLGEAGGTVEAVGLRVTRLRDINGTVWYVRNGEILRVGNMSQNWARTVLDVNVGYGEDLVKVRRVLEEVAHDLWDDEDFRGRVIEEPSVWGVQELAADGVVVRVALKTAPLEQWSVAREMRQRIKSRFDFEGIEIPFQQRVVWHREGEPDPRTGQRLDAEPRPEQA